MMRLSLTAKLEKSRRIIGSELAKMLDTLDEILDKQKPVVTKQKKKFKKSKTATVRTKA